MNKLFTLRKPIHFISLSSTNDYALKQIKTENVIEGTVFIADFQSKGKGQSNNYWESEPAKNLLISVVLCPKFLHPSQQFDLNKVISLALYDFTKDFIKDESVSIKWPNDIYINNKKVGGILIENIISGNLFEYAVVGIGININQSVFRSNAPNPISLKNITGKTYDLNECYMVLADFLEIRYSQLILGQQNKIHSDYLNSLLYYNTLSNFRKNEEIFSGTITGVNEFGKLLIKNNDNIIEDFDFKEVEFLLNHSF